MELASNATEFGKRVNALKRKMASAAKDIELIAEQGRLTQTDSGNVYSFFAMHTVLDKYFTKFETLWEDCLEVYIGEGKENDFPKPGELQYFTDVKALYYQSKTTYEKLNRLWSLTSANQSIHFESPAKRLPCLQIPTFDGDVLKFPKFRDSFASLVHNEKSFPDDVKFQFLVEALTGPAASVISSYSVQGSNYAAAWRSVIKAFDNKRLLAASHLNRLLSFKPQQGKATIDSLKTFLSTIPDCFNAFKSLKIPDESEFILFIIAVKCLDAATREQFEIASKDVEFPSVDDLTKFVRERCRAMELASNDESSSSTDEPSGP